MKAIVLLLALIAVVSAVPVANKRAITYSSVTLVNQASFTARQMANGTLSGLLTTFLQNECGLLGSICTSALSPYYQDILPSVTVIESLKAQGTTAGSAGTGNLDLLLHLLTFPPTNKIVNQALNTAFGVELLPATAVAYFTANAKYNASFTAASVDFKAQAFALFQSYSSIIEFNDTNSNKLYDAGEEVQTYNLGLQNWQDTTFTTVAVGSTTVFQVSASTADGVVSFDCDTSSFPVIDSNDQIVSPNATKCSITINGFPYKGKTSNLAIVGNIALVGAKFAGAATAGLSDFKITVGDAPANTVGGQFNWVPSVKVGTTNFAVAATGSAGATSGVVDLSTKFILSASGSATKDVRNVVFTLQTTTNPSKVFWDPAVHYGATPVKAITAVPSSAATLSFSSVLLFLSTLLVLLL